MDRIAIHIIQGPVTNESRLFKETAALIRENAVDKILIIGFKSGGLPENENIDPQCEIIRIPLVFSYFKPRTILRILMMLEFYLKVCARFLFNRVNFVHCHSLETLPLGVLFYKLKKNVRLFYDPHELETEKSDVSGMLQKIYRFLEKFLIRFPEAIFPVSNKIGQWYRQKYPVDNVYVVRNIPEIKPTQIQNSENREKESNAGFRHQLGLKDNDLLFMMQGHLVIERNIPLILEVFSEIEQRFHVVFMGNGAYVRKIREYADKYSNIHHIPAVPPDRVLHNTSNADIGLCLIENTCLSYYYSLPNKFFEYIIAGVPVIYSDFPEMMNIGAEFNIGWPVSSGKEALKNCIRKIQPEDIKEKKENCLKSSDKLNWQNEVIPLIKVYQS